LSLSFLCSAWWVTTKYVQRLKEISVKGSNLTK
jgi:hypothetical protein